MKFSHKSTLRRGLRAAAGAAPILLLTGCAEIFYDRTSTGTFSGKLDVEWIEPNTFIYRPRTSDPLTFVTSDGKIVRPRVMYTDGGSIPRLFWSAPHLGPWDFAPGFVIHDWLFLQHRCREGDWQSYDFERSASILAEAIKTQMARSKDADPVILWAIHQAVLTPVAKKSWEASDCSIPPPEPTSPGAMPPGSPTPRALRLLSIEFP